MKTYLKTKLATDWPEHKTLLSRLLDLVLFAFPKANPRYENKLHLVKEWLIEFNEDGLPWREIGIGFNGKPVIAGPDDQNYGFWLDTNMTLKDFSGEPIAEVDFEKLWQEADVQDPQN